MIDVPLKVEIGIIGYKNHATKLINLIQERTDSEIKYIFHPTKKFEDSRSTNNLSDLFTCDSIIIASPNDTHYNYIKQCCDEYDGYLFCEKPPVTSTDDLNKLEQISLEQKQRLFFNFNYRFSKTSEIIKDALNSKAMGKILFINIVSNHGLAFKKEYADSWRADGDKNLHNILETVSIHHLDLMNYHFGKLKNFVYYPSLQSKSGTSFDTCHLVLCYENDVSVSILNSYATPLIDDLSIIGTNGYLHIRSNNLEIYSPRDSFNSDGLFVTPPLHHKSSFDIEKIQLESLRNSLDYFMNHVKEKKLFDLCLFETSISSNRLVFELENSF